MTVQEETGPMLDMVTLKSEMTSQDSKDTPQREKWSAHVEYILSMVGYSVGFGNLWRFPYICNRNGGGAFLIPFLICLLITGFPMFFLESNLGQFSGKGSVEIWSICPILKGSGVASVILSTLYVPLYNILLAYPVYYMVKSCASTLPWTSCNNTWNTPWCIEDVSTLGNSSLNDTDPSNISSVVSVAHLWKNMSLKHSSVEEFWQYNVLDVSEGIHEMGSVQWHIVASMFAAYFIIFLCLFRGTKLVGKVVYVTATLPYILLIIIFIRTVIQPGALTGILYYIKPEFSKLLTLQVWLEACLQVFYSLGPGWGGIVTAASYNRFHESTMRASLIVASISEFTSILAGFVTFAILGVMAERVGLPVSEVVSSGPGLAFVAYPEALAQLPVPQLWSFLFFLMLLTVGLDSQFVNIEVAVTAIIDRFPRQFRKRRVWLLGTCCLVYFFIGIVLCTQGGPYIFQVLDWYIAALTVFIICAMECIAVTWIYGIGQLSRDIEMMLGRPVNVLLRVLWAIINPLILLVVFGMTLSQYTPPTYGSYVYPQSAIGIGWFMAVVSLVPLPVFAFLSVRKHMSSLSLKQSIKAACRPDASWGPAHPDYRQQHCHQLKHRPSLGSNLRDIFRSS